MTLRPKALITGASSGIGREFARHLAPDHDLVLTARRGDRLDALAEELAPAGAAVEVVPADLSTRSGLDTVLDRLQRGDVDMLVSNAGAGGYAPLIDLSPEGLDQLIMLNCVAPMELIRASLPGMLAKNAGSIIAVASLLAFSAGQTDERAPRRAVYGGSKAATVAFTRLTANELLNTGVRVQVLCPGLVATEFHGENDPFEGRTMSASDVVESSLVGLDLGETVCVPGLDDSDAALDALLQAETTLQNAAFALTPAPRYLAGA